MLPLKLLPKTGQIIHRVSGDLAQVYYFSTIAFLLTDLTKNDRPKDNKDWQDYHEKTLQTLKN